MTTARRQFFRRSAPLLAAPWLAHCSKGASQPAPPGVPRLGINLAELADWNTELPFVDMFRLSRAWISQAPDAPWGKGPKLALDARGWVQSLAPGHWADTPMCSASGGLHPTGTYEVVHEGKGELDFWGGAAVRARAPGMLSIDVTPGKGPIWCRLKATDPTDPVRNIRVMRPGHAAAAHPLNSFHPDFIERWQGVSCVRFMDWMRTNHSEQVRWKDRPQPQDATFSVKGAPLEVMIDLVNRLEADAWFCMPHGADDDYVQQFAAMVAQKLSPRQKVYVEFSNELWNGQFAQAREAQTAAQAARLKLGAWVAQRSLHLFGLWEKALGGRERLVRVMPSHAANRWYSEEMLKHQDAFRLTDVLAIAPYLSLNLPPDNSSGGKGLTAPEVESWSVDMLLDHLESKALPECIEWMKGQKALADQYGVKLVAYEGGQHLVGILGAENREPLTRLLMAANAHPRMQVLYERYFEAWAAAGGDLHCHFNSVSAWSKWGSWGLLQHAGEDRERSPKYRAAMSWAKKQGQKVKLGG